MRKKSFEKLHRRSSSEIGLEIVSLCNYPGLPLTRLMTRANLNHTKLREILFMLIEDRLIKTDTRKISYTGQKRETAYYVTTPEGDQALQEQMISD